MGEGMAPHSGPSIGRRARVKASTPCGVPALTLRAPTSSRPSMGSQGEPCQGTRRPEERRSGMRRPMARKKEGIDTGHGLAGSCFVVRLARTGKYIALLQAEPTAIPCPRPAPDSARVGAVPG